MRIQRKHASRIDLWRDPAVAGRALVSRRFPVSISRVMESIKAGSTLRVKTGRRGSGPLRQPRFSDGPLRSVKEYNEEAELAHLNPGRASPVKRARERAAGSLKNGSLRSSFDLRRASGYIPFQGRGRVSPALSNLLKVSTGHPASVRFQLKLTSLLVVGRMGWV